MFRVVGERSRKHPKNDMSRAKEGNDKGHLLLSRRFPSLCSSDGHEDQILEYYF
jgi:hypothetical protein